MGIDFAKQPIVEQAAKFVVGYCKFSKANYLKHLRVMMAQQALMDLPSRAIHLKKRAALLKLGEARNYLHVPNLR